MDREYLERLDPYRLPSPCFVVDEERIEKNLAVLDSVQRQTGAKILLALKGFAMHSIFPTISRVLAGTCASGLFEAILGRSLFGKEVHVCSPAYDEQEVLELIPIADHIVFNSFSQLERFHPVIKKSKRRVETGIRVNPEHSEGKVAIYDPCSFGSRLGVRRADFKPELLHMISGLHFHTLCEHNSDALFRTLSRVEELFGEFLKGLEWLNMGGGHHITRKDYDIALLMESITRVKKKYGVEVYLEPGEAVALDAGILVSTVLDVIKNDMHIAILDTSAACHMPDVLEMPYRPLVIGAGLPWEKKWTCRLGGRSCLAGDVIGEYSFDHPLKAGDRIAFLDMAIYSMVKTNTFNGVPLPAIARYRPSTDQLVVVRHFGYEDYMTRLS